MTAQTLEHGMTMYRYRNCRCNICYTAAQEARRKYRKPKPPRIRLDYQPLVARLTEQQITQFVGWRTIREWESKNGIDLYAADRWCIKLGFHPTQIWGTDFYQGIEPE